MTATDAGGVVVVEFDNAHPQNPFSMSRMVELTELLTALDADPAVGCVVLFGGEGRSFAAGGDFNETSEFLGGPEVDAWIDRITDLYSTIASISCPVLAAIDGYAIGLGLQMSLCCDYRIGSTRAALIMPEFRLGIACNLGGFLLEQVVGRSVMQNMLFTCEAWPAERALADGLLHRVTEPEAVLDEAVCRARTISGYTRAAVRSTRPRINESVVRGLEVVRQQGKASHRSAFAAGEAQKRMRDILGRGEA